MVRASRSDRPGVRKNPRGRSPSPNGAASCTGALLHSPRAAGTSSNALHSPSASGKIMNVVDEHMFPVRRRHLNHCYTPHITSYNTDLLRSDGPGSILVVYEFDCLVPRELVLVSFYLLCL